MGLGIHFMALREVFLRTGAHFFGFREQFVPKIVRISPLWRERVLYVAQVALFLFLAYTGVLHVAGRKKNKKRKNKHTEQEMEYIFAMTGTRAALTGIHMSMETAVLNAFDPKIHEY